MAFGILAVSKSRRRASCVDEKLLRLASGILAASKGRRRAGYGDENYKKKDIIVFAR